MTPEITVGRWSGEAPPRAQVSRSALRIGLDFGKETQGRPSRQRNVLSKGARQEGMNGWKLQVPAGSFLLSYPQSLACSRLSISICGGKEGRKGGGREGRKGGREMN